MREKVNIDHNGNGYVFCDGVKHYLQPNKKSMPEKIDRLCYKGRLCVKEGIK